MLARKIMKFLSSRPVLCAGTVYRTYVRVYLIIINDGLETYPYCADRGHREVGEHAMVSAEVENFSDKTSY